MGGQAFWCGDPVPSVHDAVQLTRSRTTQVDNCLSRAQSRASRTRLSETKATSRLTSRSTNAPRAPQRRRRRRAKTRKFRNGYGWQTCRTTSSLHTVEGLQSKPLMPSIASQ